jgi:hypothetical protein
LGCYILLLDFSITVAIERWTKRNCLRDTSSLLRIHVLFVLVCMYIC